MFLFSMQSNIFFWLSSDFCSPSFVPHFFVSFTFFLVSLSSTFSLFLFSPPLCLPPSGPFESTVENELHFHLAWQIKRSIKASKCHLYLAGRSIQLQAIQVSLSEALALRKGDINHVGQDLCGHCGSLQIAAWDTNRQSSCWISAFELLAWLKTPVHLCVN